MNIVVLAGGLSTERDVSFKSGSQVAKALRELGHKVILLDVFMGYLAHEQELSAEVFDRGEEVSVKGSEISSEAPDLEAVKKSRAGDPNVFFGPNVISLCRMADLVFMALHGADGENGKVQAAFDLYGIRYTGNGYLGSALAMDKGVAKTFFASKGVPTPEGYVISRREYLKDSAMEPKVLPCVVKPACGGSSIGVTIVEKAEDFAGALKDAFALEEEVVVERYIRGREFSVGVIHHKALPVIEIAPVQGFYDYKNKYAAGAAVETCPADLPEDVSAQMRKYAEDAAEALGLSTYSRMDFLLDEISGEMFCLEANTLPGMTPTSLMPQEAQAVGMDYGAFCQEIIRVSMEKYED